MLRREINYKGYERRPKKNIFFSKAEHKGGGIKLNFEKELKI